MSKILHPVAGAVALATIATFWLSTALTELFASHASVTTAKTAIPWGFLLLVPALAATGGSGFKLAKGARTGLIGTKLKRMPFIAGNGILVLMPAAFFLAFKAKAGEFDATFYAVQAIELAAGATNITLLGLNMRDGLRASGRLHRMGKPSFEARLIGRDIVAEGTMAFRFAKPAGFNYVAGQSALLALIDPSETDVEGNSRTLTIASAPHEPELMFVTRLRETAFKRTLKTMSTGGLVRITGPAGDMTLHDDPARPAVFLAGGIGITPFLSMARHAAHAKLPHRISLFYSNRRPGDAAFLGELRQLEETNPNFRLVATMTAAPESAEPWPGETGVISPEMLRRHLPDVLAPVYYVAGPASMVTTMREMLGKIGIAQQDVRFEEFYGY